MTPSHVHSSVLGSAWLNGDRLALTRKQGRMANPPRRHQARSFSLVNFPPSAGHLAPASAGGGWRHAKGSISTPVHRRVQKGRGGTVTLIGPANKEVARQLGVSDTSLGAWAKEMSENAEASDAELEREAARLRKRIKELETEIDILKKFTAYWVKGSP